MAVCTYDIPLVEQVEVSPVQLVLCQLRLHRLEFTVVDNVSQDDLHNLVAMIIVVIDACLTKDFGLLHRHRFRFRQWLWDPWGCGSLVGATR